MFTSQYQYGEAFNMLWLIVIVISVYLVVRQWKIKKLLEVANKVNCGIKSYPLIGHAYLFLGDGAKRMQAFQIFGSDAIKNGGMSSLWLGEKYFVVTVDVVDIEVILKTSLEKDNVMRFGRNLIGNGSIFAPVAIWRSRRKGLAPTFNMQNLNNFVAIFVHKSNIMVKKLQTVVGTGAVSIWQYATTLTLDSVCETAMGLTLDSQRNHEEPFLHSFETCCKLIASRMVNPWLYPNAVYRRLPYHVEFSKNKKVIWNFIEEAIRSKQNMLKEKKIKNSTYYDVKSFLELLIDSPNSDRSFTDLELQEEILVLVVAATDTSAVGISFVVSMLAKHQEVQEKVVQELQEVLSDSDRPITADDLPHLMYLSAVIKETLRLYPPVPIIVREIDRDLELPSGLALTSGCGVLVNIWATHRNPVYWGSDAEQFKPERFLEAPLKHPAAYLAFSYGPRSCLGYQYAMMSMKTAIASLLRKYRLLSADEGTKTGTKNSSDEPMKVAFDVMLKDVDGFRVKLEARSKYIHD